MKDDRQDTNKFEKSVYFTCFAAFTASSEIQLMSTDELEKREVETTLFASVGLGRMTRFR